MIKQKLFLEKCQETLIHQIDLPILQAEEGNKVDKKTIILGLLLIITLTIIIILGIKLKNRETNDNMIILKKYGVNNNVSPEKGLVPDEETARKIAEIVLLPIYGDSISHKKPFNVNYDEEYKAWIVKGTITVNENEIGLGGVPNVIIQKSDGRILAVWHDK